MTPPDPEERDLIAHALGELSGAERLGVEQWIAGSPEARRRFEEVRAVVRTLQSDDTVAPSRAAIRRLIALQRSSTPASSPSVGEWIDRAQRVLASLVFDSAAAPALAGFRGALDARQLIFETDAGRLDVMISPGEGPRAMQMRGQLRTESSGTVGDVALVHPGTDDPVATAEADARGGFRLAAPAGTYDLVVRHESALIVAERVGMESDMG